MNCPDCGQEIVFTSCGITSDLSDESARAIADIVLAAHRRMVHPSLPTEVDADA